MDRLKRKFLKEKLTVAHPRDRRVRQLEKREKRAQKVIFQKGRVNMSQRANLLRYLWFRDQCVALGITHGLLSEDEALLLTQVYIDRHQREAEELRQERNPPQGRLRQLAALTQDEMDAFRSAKGVSIPQVTTLNGMKSLAEWDGSEETAKFVDTQTVSLGSRKMDVGALSALVARLEEVGGGGSDEDESEEAGEAKRHIANRHLRQKGASRDRLARKASAKSGKRGDAVVASQRKKKSKKSQ